MKNSLLLIITLTMYTAVTAQSYCTPSYTGPGFNNTGNPTSFYNHILHFSIGDLSHTVAAPLANPSPNYADFTNISTELARGATYSLTVEVGNGANDQTIAIWIDYNQNNLFESSERVFTRRDTANRGNHRHVASITVPAGAVLDSTRIRVGTLYGFNAPDPCVNNSGALDWAQHFHDYTAVIKEPSLQTFLSSTTNHPNLDELVPGTSNNPMLRIAVRTNVTGTLSPLNAGDFNFSTIGTTNPSEIASARLYFTGSRSEFINPVQVGQDEDSPSTYFTITANQPLLQGYNYFWLVYDVDTGAILGNRLDARNNSIDISVPRIPSVVSPGGDRKVGYCVSRGSQPYFLYVQNVTLNTLNVTSTYGTGYSNYTTAASTELTRGNKYPISLLYGNSVNPGLTRVWIDFNRDGDFDDPGEQVVDTNWTASQANPNTTAISDTIDIPSNAVVGPTRMRVSIQFSPSPLPCDNPVRIGEVEDYTVVISETGEPVADFDANVACLGSATNFRDTSTAFGNYNIVSWYWEFGDGDTSTQQHPQHTYAAPGVYNATLTVNSNKPGTPSAIKKSIKVNRPKAEFSYSSSVYRIPIRFTDETVGGTVQAWEWNFGDPASGGQNTSAQESPTHVFDTAGTYNVQLITTTEGGCRDTVNKTIVIVNAVKPIAEFSAPNYDPYKGAQVQLQDQSANNPTNWKWIFNPNYVTFHNGTSDTSQNPVVSFDSLTTYQVMLIASNMAGADTVSYQFTTKNYSAPVADFSANTTDVKAGQIITFQDMSTNDPTNWSWAFGDGDSAFTENPLHTYLNTGSFTVKLNVSNPAGGDSETKNNYISVSNRYRMCQSDVPNSPLYLGYLYDSGDSTGNYRPNSNCGFLIKPGCAGPITLTFTSFAMLTGHVVRVYDGEDNTGTPLHTGNGFSGSGIPNDVTAYSGAMYIEEITTSTGTAAGFAARWSAVPNISPQVSINADTVGYIGSSVTFRAQAQLGTGNTFAWDTDNDGSDDAFGDRITRTFDSTGYYPVRLISRNCKGADTAVHTIHIIVPVSVPVSDFISSKDTVLPFEEVQLFDISGNGPTSWKWEFSTQDMAFVDGTTDTSQNPVVIFFESGYYTVKLTASNLVGTGNTETKIDYIYVKGSGQMCTFPFRNNFESGQMTDDGGDAGNYGNNSNCDFLLNPCAKKITLVFREFDYAAGDYLRVFDGEDNTGNPLHSGQGFTGSSLPPALTANSGKMYFEQVTNATTNAKGFVADWVSVKKDAPAAVFSAPDTGYTGGGLVPFSNQSTGKGNSYYWYFDNNSSVDDSTENPVYSYTNAGTYNVMLIAKNCAGADTAIKQIIILNPAAAPVVEFSSNYTRASVEDTIRLQDKSDNGPNSWRWEITPANFSFINGTDQNSPWPVLLFNDTGRYTVKLVVENSFGADSIARVDYLHIFRYCTPVVNNLSTDLGISRVKFNTINNQSTIGNSGYTNYFYTHSTNITSRASYPITVERTGNSTNTTRKVWIDYNQDGDFDDQGELVAQQGSSTSLSWTDTFTIPGTALLGATRMRVGVGHALSSNTPCGPNNFGEFEDYRIVITLDNTAPVITLKGSATENVEVGYAYVDSGATAMDDLDGDITHKIVSGGTVDTGTVGTYYIRYNVKDSAGNAAEEVVRTVKVTQDKTKPVITLLGADPLYMQVHTSFADPGATASDNRDGDVSANVVTQVNIDTSKLGSYDVIYSAYDNSGNAADPVVRTVIVEDTMKPVVSLIGDTTVNLYLNDSWTDPGVMYSDNYYDSTDLSLTIGGTYSGTSTEGTFIRSYEVSDPSGNTAAISRTIIVEDTTTGIKEKPELDVNAYPNPNNGSFYIASNGLQGFSADVRITDLAGKIIYENRIDFALRQEKVYISLPQAKSGLYLMYITAEQGHKGVPLVISR